MGREWMQKNRMSKEYVEYFIRFSLDHGADPKRTPCPCKNCSNFRWISIDEIRNHPFMCGIYPLYTRWVWHGETHFKDSVGHNTDSNPVRDMFDGDQIDDMIHDVEANLQSHPDLFENLISEAHKPLYASCTRFTRFSALLKLPNLKVSNGWTDKCFTTLLELVNEMLPDDNCLPQCTYEEKKIVRSIGLNYERIHACPNDFLLYRKEYKSLENCPNPKFGAPRDKKNGAPSKVLWYFPIIPRFRQVFDNPKDTGKLTWNANERIKDGKLRHPTDSAQWKTIEYNIPRVWIRR